RVDHLGVARAVAEVYAVGEQVAEAAAGDDQTVRDVQRARAHPEGDLGVLDPDVLEARAHARAAVEAVVDGHVVARRRLALDREVVELAAAGDEVEARERPAQRRVPHAGAAHGDAVDLHPLRVATGLRRHVPRAGADPHALAHVAGRGRAVLQRLAV